MFTINNTINEIPVKGLKVSKLSTSHAEEILLISLEKGTLFPEHISPRDAQLIVLEGDIDFHIKSTVNRLKKLQMFNFPKNEKHWVKANENSKFLIIR